MALLHVFAPQEAWPPALRWVSGLFCASLPWSSSEAHCQRLVGVGGGPMVGQGLQGLLSFPLPGVFSPQVQAVLLGPQGLAGCGGVEGAQCVMAGWPRSCHPQVCTLQASHSP